MSARKRYYINGTDYAWYDSSNVVCSMCTASGEGCMVTVVFKEGRTYLYKDVAKEDYTLFRDGESQGKMVFSILRKYSQERLADTDLGALCGTLSALEAMERPMVDGLVLSLRGDGTYTLSKCGTAVSSGESGACSAVNVLTELGIPFSMYEMDEESEECAACSREDIASEGLELRYRDDDGRYELRLSGRNERIFAGTEGATDIRGLLTALRVGVSVEAE